MDNKEIIEKAFDLYLPNIPESLKKDIINYIEAFSDLAKKSEVIEKLQGIEESISKLEKVINEQEDQQSAKDTRKLEDEDELLVEHQKVINEMMKKYNEIKKIYPTQKMEDNKKWAMKDNKFLNDQWYNQNYTNSTKVKMNIIPEGED